MVYVAGVVSAQPELIEPFVTAVTGGYGSAGKVTLRGITDVCLEPMRHEDLSSESTRARARDQDFCILLARFLDSDTLERMRDVIRQLPHQSVQNLHVTICRNAGETEYKISCTKCNQRLLVRDAFAFRRVHCPRCSEMFMVRGEADLIRGELLLNATRMVRKVVLGDPVSCREALEGMIGQTKQRIDSSKNSTMRIELPALDRSAM
jgi:hypothetical protein